MTKEPIFGDEKWDNWYYKFDAFMDKFSVAVIFLAVIYGGFHVAIAKLFGRF